MYKHTCMHARAHAHTYVYIHTHRPRIESGTVSSVIHSHVI